MPPYPAMIANTPNCGGCRSKVDILSSISRPACAGSWQLICQQQSNMVETWQDTRASTEGKAQGPHTISNMKYLGISKQAQKAPAHGQPPRTSAVPNIITNASDGVRMAAQAAAHRWRRRGHSCCCQTLPTLSEAQHRAAHGRTVKTTHSTWMHMKGRHRGCCNNAGRMAIAGHDVTQAVPTKQHHTPHLGHFLAATTRARLEHCVPLLC